MIFDVKYNFAWLDLLKVDGEVMLHANFFRVSLQVNFLAEQSAAIEALVVLNAQVFLSIMSVQIAQLSEPGEAPRLHAYVAYNDGSLGLPSVRRVDSLDWNEVPNLC